MVDTFDHAQRKVTLVALDFQTYIFNLPRHSRYVFLHLFYLVNDLGRGGF